jgi:hypothetical protein
VLTMGSAQVILWGMQKTAENEAREDSQISPNEALTTAAGSAIGAGATAPWVAAAWRNAPRDRSKPFPYIPGPPWKKILPIVAAGGILGGAAGYGAGRLIGRDTEKE